MKIKVTVAALTLTALSFSSHAAWTINSGWCQSLTTDGSLMVRVKQTQVGIVELAQDCGGRPTTARSTVGLVINGEAHQAMAVCTSATNYQTAVFLPDTSDVNAINASLKTTAHSAQVRVLDRDATLNMAGFNETCGALIGTPAAQKNILQDEANNQIQVMRKMGYVPDGQGGWRKLPREQMGQ